MQNVLVNQWKHVNDNKETDRLKYTPKFQTKAYIQIYNPPGRKRSQVWRVINPKTKGKFGHSVVLGAIIKNELQRARVGRVEGTMDHWEKCLFE